MGGELAVGLEELPALEFQHSLGRKAPPPLKGEFVGQAHTHAAILSVR